MNAMQLASTAYGAAALPLRTPRSAEHDVLARITGRIRQAAADNDFPALAHALNENRRIWTFFAADVADKQNGLPSALRAQVFYLAEFTDLHTRKVLSRRADIDVLVDINAAVLAGLRQAGDVE